MRITFLTHFPGRGGSTVMLAQLAEYFSSRGHSITVVCGTDDRSPLLSNYLVAPKGRYRRENYLRLIESTAPDLVYSISGVEELDLMRSLRVPRVRHVFSLEAHDTINIEKLLVDCAPYLESVTANTIDVLETIRKQTNSRLTGTLAPYRLATAWLEAPEPSMVKTGRVKVCFAGRLEAYQKRAHWLATIIPGGEKAGLPLEWHIHGEGPEESLLRRKLGSLARSGHTPVHFHGWGQPDSLRQAFQNYDLFFLCSRWEGLPIAMVEAMLSGQTCVVPSIPAGIVDLLENTGAGWTYDARSPDRAIEALKAAWKSGEIPDRRRVAQTLAKTKFSSAVTDCHLARLEDHFLTLAFNGRYMNIKANRPIRSGAFLGHFRRRTWDLVRRFESSLIPIAYDYLPRRRPE